MATSSSILESFDALVTTLAGNRRVLASRVVVQVETTDGQPGHVDEITIQTRRKDVRPGWEKRQEYEERRRKEDRDY